MSNPQERFLLQLEGLVIDTSSKHPELYTEEEADEEECADDDFYPDAEA